MKLRPATAADADAILALNQESVAVLSPLSPERLAQLQGEAAVRRVIEDDGAVVAFLLAFREGAAYDSPNYRWFAERYERFLYVDRVAVASAARSRGAGALLYRDVFEFAATCSVGLVTCEYDVEPPNPASERFHARFGFREVGRQRLDGGKLVSLQAAQVTGRASHCRNPMSNDEQTYLEPSGAAARAFFSQPPPGSVVMLNLLRFRDVADYSASPELAPAAPISGESAYRKYIAHTLPHLEKSGGTLLFYGRGGNFLIGPADERWDAAMLVRQRDAAAFLAFASNAEYLAGLGHRTAALEDSRLLPLGEETA